MPTIMVAFIFEFCPDLGAAINPIAIRVKPSDNLGEFSIRFCSVTFRAIAPGVITAF
jgi:hypothetical protein